MIDEPRRLVDRQDTSAALHQDLRAAILREPIGYDVDRGLARFEAWLADPASSTFDPSAATGTASAGASGIPIGAWVAGAIGLTGLVAGAVLVLGDQAESDPTESIGRPLDIERPAEAVSEPKTPPDGAALVSEAEPVAPANPTARVQSVAKPRSVARPKTASTNSVAPTSGEHRLQAEMRALAEARSTLSKDPKRALMLVRSAEREFGDGLFAEEWHALEVLALSALGQTREAHARATVFLRRWPKSAFAERVRRVTDGANPAER